MRIDKMTIKLQEALASAQSYVGELCQQSIECEHLLIALLKEDDGIASAIVRKVGVDPALLLQKLNDKANKYPQVKGGDGQVYVSVELKEIIESAFAEAKQLNDEFLSAEHILLAVAGKGRISASKIFNSMGLNRDFILQAMQTIRGTQRVTDQNPESKYQVLDKFCVDLTERARSGKLDRRGRCTSLPTRRPIGSPVRLQRVPR